MPVLLGPRLLFRYFPIFHFLILFPLLPYIEKTKPLPISIAEPIFSSGATASAFAVRATVHSTLQNSPSEHDSHNNPLTYDEIAKQQQKDKKMKAMLALPDHLLKPQVYHGGEKQTKL